MCETGSQLGDTHKGYKCPAEATSTILKRESCLANIFVELGSRPIDGGLSHVTYHQQIGQSARGTDHATVCLLHVTG